MKRLLLFSVIVLSCVVSYSYGKTKPWSKGKVTLYSGEVIECELRFTRKVKEGLLYIRQSLTKEQILTVRQVRSFEYFDEKRNLHRSFTTLSVQPELSGKRHEVFMEIIFQGTYFTIVNHRTLGYEKNRLNINPFTKKVVVDNAYLVCNKNQETVPLTRENLMQMIDGKQSEVDAYIRSKRSLKSVQDYTAVLEYHQALF